MAYAGFFKGGGGLTLHAYHDGEGTPTHFSLPQKFWVNFPDTG